MMFLGVVFAIVEVYLFAFLGDIIDWLSNSDCDTFLADESHRLIFMRLVTLVVLPLLSLSHSLLMHQAILGSHYARVVLGLKNPRVGLLTIGTEEGKGTDLILNSE